ncbi:MAG: lipoprotein insertase outer membrane protein LolB [Pseudidiomarina maritima]|nr:lipoprotein insertase outer membrane protein LolB [Pseudidiomarina maritima]
MKRLLLVVLLSGWLSACSTVPTSTTTTMVSAGAIAAQQQQLAELTQWRLRGQMAIFDLRENDRHGIYVDWNQSPNLVSMRFSHPLKGTLATLEQTSNGALLIDNDGNEYRDNSASALLERYFAVQLPFDLLPQLVLGVQPEQMFEAHYQLLDDDPQQRALLADYQLLAARQMWTAELRQYQPVATYLLPHSIDLTSAHWRLKLKVSQWLL